MHHKRVQVFLETCTFIYTSQKFKIFSFFQEIWMAKREDLHKTFVTSCDERSSFPSQWRIYRVSNLGVPKNVFRIWFKKNGLAFIRPAYFIYLFSVFKNLQPFEMYFHWLNTFNYVHILELQYVEIFIVVFPVSSFWQQFFLLSYKILLFILKLEPQ